MSLETTFRDLCARYFPRWRGAAHWTIRHGPRAQWHRGTDTRVTSEQGYCDRETKTIWITVRSRDLAAVIIHETCHAVCGGWHGRTWQHRMHQAQRRAEARGDTALAAALAADSAGYAAPGLPMTAGTVYNRVQDMLVDAPSATLDAIVDAIAYDYCMTPDEVLHRYRRLAYWYTRYRREEVATAHAHLRVAARFGMDATHQAYWQQRLDALTRELPGGAVQKAGGRGATRR